MMEMKAYNQEQNCVSINTRFTMPTTTTTTTTTTNTGRSSSSSISSNTIVWNKTSDLNVAGFRFSVKQQPEEIVHREWRVAMQQGTGRQYYYKASSPENTTWEKPINLGSRPLTRVEVNSANILVSTTNNDNGNNSPNAGNYVYLRSETEAILRMDADFDNNYKNKLKQLEDGVINNPLNYLEVSDAFAFITNFYGMENEYEFEQACVTTDRHHLFPADTNINMYKNRENETKFDYEIVQEICSQHQSTEQQKKSGNVVSFAFRFFCDGREVEPYDATPKKSGDLLYREVKVTPYPLSDDLRREEIEIENENKKFGNIEFRVTPVVHLKGNKSSKQDDNYENGDDYNEAVKESTKQDHFLKFKVIKNINGKQALWCKESTDVASATIQWKTNLYRFYDMKVSRDLLVECGIVKPPPPSNKLNPIEIADDDEEDFVPIAPTTTTTTTTITSSTANDNNRASDKKRKYKLYSPQSESEEKSNSCDGSTRNYEPSLNEEDLKRQLADIKRRKMELKEQKAVLLRKKVEQEMNELKKLEVEVSQLQESVKDKQ